MSRVTPSGPTAFTLEMKKRVPRFMRLKLAFWRSEKLLPAFLRKLNAHTRCFEENLCDLRHAIEHRYGAGKGIELHDIASNQLI